jgi:hypothetical protein
MPDDVGVLGFKTHCDKTHFSALARLDEISGFDIEYYCLGYYSSGYAEFFFPLWCCSYAYDCIRFALGWKNLSSYNLFLLKKPGRLLEEEYSRDFELYARGKDAPDGGVQQLGVGREADVLRLHRGVDRDPLKVLAPQRPARMRHPQALG